MIAIYVRQSVDKKDSISIESQVEFCKYETRGEAFNIYADKGYSGKNTERPNFKLMVEDIKEGKISKVIVYKLDRISRSILDFANMMQLFEKYHVEFNSSTEKFDTSSPMGRAMLNICIVFAQLERETIQKRVKDSYHSRSEKGFYMGGHIPYGYKLEKTVIQGINTSKYVIEPEEVEHIKLLYELYSKPTTSVTDIINYFKENEIIKMRGKPWSSARIGEILKNPIYVKADIDIYDFFKNQKTIIHNNPDDFIGVNGCYLYTGENAGRKQSDLTNQNLVIAPHDGIVDSDLWLKVRYKLMQNKQVQVSNKAKNTWLAGKIKCIKCGYTLSVRQWKGKNHINKYLICNNRIQTRNCEGVGGIRLEIVENIVFQEIKNKLQEFKILTKENKTDINPKLLEYNLKIEKIEKKISNLIEKIPIANEATMKYINEQMTKLDGEKSQVLMAISDLQRQGQKTDIKQITDYINKWDNISFEDKRIVLDALIDTIYANKTEINIKWKV